VWERDGEAALDGRRSLSSELQEVELNGIMRSRKACLTAMLL